MAGCKKAVYQALDDSEYAEFFGTYLEHSTSEYKAMLKLSKPVVDSFEQKPIDLLSVGAGTLCFEKSLIEMVGLKVNYLYAIEPNEKHLEELKSAITELTQNYYIDPVYFTTEFSTEKRFDMVLMSHCLYYMPDPVGVILKAKSLLKPNGKVVIFLVGELGAYELNTYLSQHVELFGESYNNHNISSKEISEALTNNELCHEVRLELSGLEVHDFITRNATPTANHVISFMVQTKYEFLAQNLQDGIYDMVKERSSIGKDGKYIFKNNNAMIIVE